MDLSAFMRAAGLDDAQVAEAVGCHRATISRLRRGVTRPQTELFVALNGWAEGLRRRKRWPRSLALTWDGLEARARRRPRKAG